MVALIRCHSVMNSVMKVFSKKQEVSKQSVTFECSLDVTDSNIVT